jgi:hypothetical protein
MKGRNDMAKELKATNVEVKDGRITGTFVIRAGCAQSSINPLWIFDGDNPLEFDLAFDIDAGELAADALRTIWIDIQNDLRKITDERKVSMLQDHTTLIDLDKAIAALVPKGKRGQKMAELRMALNDKDRQIAELEAQIAALMAKNA